MGGTHNNQNDAAYRVQHHTRIVQRLRSRHTSTQRWLLYQILKVALLCSSTRKRVPRYSDIVRKTCWHLFDLQGRHSLLKATPTGGDPTTGWNPTCDTSYDWTREGAFDPDHLALRLIHCSFPVEAWRLEFVQQTIPMSLVWHARRRIHTSNISLISLNAPRSTHIKYNNSKANRTKSPRVAYRFTSTGITEYLTRTQSKKQKLAQLQSTPPTRLTKKHSRFPGYMQHKRYIYSNWHVYCWWKAAVRFQQGKILDSSGWLLNGNEMASWCIEKQICWLYKRWISTLVAN